jgi:hypothetical protein
MATGTPVSLDHAMNEGLQLPPFGYFVTGYGNPPFASAQLFSNGVGHRGNQEQAGSSSQQPETDGSASCSSNPVFVNPPPYAASTKAAPEAIAAEKVSDA